jgi:hypothetical protein
MVGAPPWQQLASFAPLVVASWLCLVRAGLLPGGWRLEGWIEPRERVEARERALSASLRLAAIGERARLAPEGAILWLGHSTVERLEPAAHHPLHPQFNAGVASTRADDLVRVLERLVPARRPGGVVVVSGTADRLALPGRPLEAAAAVERLVAAIEERLPGVPLLVVGPLPQVDGEGEADVRALQAALSAMAARRGHAFVDPAREPLVDERFRLRPRFAVDEVHLSAMGYTHYAALLRGAQGPVAEALRR